jgi:hypothetical protein
MNFKKLATKSIALALVGVTISTPILNAPYAYSQSISAIEEACMNKNMYIEEETEVVFNDSKLTIDLW